MLHPINNFFYVPIIRTSLQNAAQGRPRKGFGYAMATCAIIIKKLFTVLGGYFYEEKQREKNYQSKFPFDWLTLDHSLG